VPQEEQGNPQTYVSSDPFFYNS